jgi:hypothetical protein
MELGLKYTIGPDGAKTITIPDERRAAVIAFVREGAAGPAGTMASIVQEGHDVLLAALEGVSETQAAFKPAAADWSILELMAHVVTTKQIVATLCRNLSEGHLPPGFGPQFEEQAAQDGVTMARFATLAESLVAAEAAHADLLATIRGLSDATDGEVRFRHFLFGALNCREWAVFQRIHDGDHTPQIASIKAAPAYPAA